VSLISHGNLELSFPINGWANDLAVDDCGNIYVYRWNDSKHDVYDSGGQLLYSENVGMIAGDVTGNEMYAANLYGNISNYDITCENENITYPTVTLTVTDNDDNEDTCSSIVTLDDPFGACCPVILYVAPTPIVDGVYTAEDFIHSDNKVPAGGDVDFHSSKTVELNPGFEVAPSALFHAYIDGCIPMSPIISGEDLKAKDR